MLSGHILAQLAPTRGGWIRRIPAYIQLIGDGAVKTITRFVRPGAAGEHSARDYDFPTWPIKANQAEGYAVARKVLGRA
ncbi:DUF3734 domain-containing protein [Xanthobacter sediminis]